MSEVDNLAKIVKMIDDLKRSIENMEKRTNIVSEEFALSIAKFINTLWMTLRVPEDVKVKLLELTLDYVLRAALRVRYPAKTTCEEDIPKEYVI
ncbi:MAG: hypothetical protein GXO10_05795 [Crenarchaeota archaeon]|nr:hypothetical protein [Thermoproteota archaeon]